MTEEAKTPEVVPEPRLSGLRQPTKVDGGGNVKVFCRFRPLNARELDTTGTETCVDFKNEKTCSTMGINKVTGNNEPIDYTFDGTFDPTV